jgi:hypothetical protein
MAGSERCPACGSSLRRDEIVCRHCGASSSSVTDAGGTQPPAAGGAVADALLAELQEALAPQIQVIRSLGTGGMGAVFLGRDPALRRLVAIKVLLPDLTRDEAARTRFTREAQAAAAVGHPNVVSVYQVGALPRSGAPYFVMQFIDGATLSEATTSGAPLPESRARRVVGEVAAALAAAHSRGMVHRDIKPGNIIVEAESERAVVLDFGISAAVDRPAMAGDDRLTATGVSLGTPMYMSPEQAATQDATPKSDVYSLGVVAFELLCGRPPFTGRSAMEVIAAHIKDQPPKVGDERPDLDPGFADLVDACLAKTPEERPSAEEIARYLLPSLRPLVEWPPPGLDRLRGLGTRLYTATGVAVGLGWLLFATLLLQPTQTMACCWPELEKPGVWDATVRLVGAALPIRLEATDILPLWIFVLAGIVFACPVLIAFVCRRAWSLADQLRWARRSGYPWPVLLAVAWDRRVDTGALWNGMGPYAMLPEAQRRRLLWLRRWEAALIGAAIVLAALMPALWLAGVTPAAPSARATLPSGEAVLLLLPALAALIASAACARPEARFRRRTRAGGRRPGAEVAAPVRPELVSAWLAAVGVPGGKPTLLPVSRLALTVGLAALVVALLSAVAAGVGVTINAGYSVTRAAAAAAPAPGAGRRAARSWSEALRAAAAGGGASSASAPDVAVARALMRMASERTTPLGSGPLREVARLDSALRVSRRPPAALFADPSSIGDLRVISDTSWPPIVRWDRVTNVVTGFCLNSREILFGVDPRRLELLGAAAERTTDIPRSGDWIELNRRWLQQWIGAPSAALAATGVRVDGLMTVLGWFRLGGLRDRLTACLHL